MRHCGFAMVIALLAVFGAKAVAQEMPVPVPMQAALLKKILSFDKALAGKGSISVVVMGGGGEIVSAFNGVGLAATSSSSVGGDVVYVGPGAPAPKAATAKAGILSVSGVPSNAEKGLVSIALDVEGGKPKIVVNLAQLKAEGHELSADLLKLAKVIQ